MINYMLSAHIDPLAAIIALSVELGLVLVLVLVLGCEMGRRR